MTLLNKRTFNMLCEIIASNSLLSNVNAIAFRYIMKQMRGLQCRLGQEGFKRRLAVAAKQR